MKDGLEGIEEAYEIGYQDGYEKGKEKGFDLVIGTIKKMKTDYQAGIVKPDDEPNSVEGQED